VIDLGGWFNAEASSDALERDVIRDTASSDILSQSLGDAKVWCLVSGELIEQDEQTSGQTRFVCLDAEDTYYSCASYSLVHATITAVKKVYDRANRVQKIGEENKLIDVKVIASRLVETIQRIYAFNPLTLEFDDLVNGKAIWIKESAHFWHLRNRIEKPLSRLHGEFGPFVSSDTPAAVIDRALKEFKSRLAIGIPDMKHLNKQADCYALRDINHPCPLLEAANINLVPNRDFLWLTYDGLQSLAVITAKIIRCYVPRGSYVGLAGYNGMIGVCS
jgi:hypothetical protein